MATNYELKAGYNNLESAVILCRELKAEHIGLDTQVDTYFVVPNGRLKLRESTLSDSSLIFYSRVDTPEPKESEYNLVRLQGDASVMRELLTQALGVLVQVKKTRDIWVYRDTTIHLDTVDSLGTFIEFEYRMTASVMKDNHVEELEFLRRHFGITRDSLVKVSYSDLVLNTGSNS
ncbi:MAG: class IV adenylate cyclase [Dehalococcoidales bacterium]|nr:class IV adenylate cyclase [Dehalococcoidales bacterium]